MTNAEIILHEYMLHNIPATEDLHTFAKWKSLGFKVKKGEHGIETRLWKLKTQATKDEKEEVETGKTESKGRFFLAKAYLFKTSQVERIEEDAQTT